MTTEWQPYYNRITTVLQLYYNRTARELLEPESQFACEN